MFEISNNLSNIFFKDTSKTKLIENTQKIKKCNLLDVERNREDAWTADITYCWGHKFGLVEYRLGEFWRSERDSELKVSEKQNWEINLVEILCNFEAQTGEECLDLNGQVDGVKILDVQTYSM